MNSRRYCIGFFAGIFLLSLLYIFSDLRFQSAEEGVRAEEGIVYYLEEEEGKVSIYQGEEHTLYEKTSIPVKQLPAGIQEEIREGKSLFRGRGALQLSGKLQQLIEKRVDVFRKMV